MARRNLTTHDGDAEQSLLNYRGVIQRRNKSKLRLWIHEFCIITIITLVVLLFLVFTIVFVVFPITLRYSIGLQRLLLFMPHNIRPDEFTTLWQYANGTRNLYVTVNDAENITLGVWHLLPEELISEASEKENFDYAHALAQPDYPVILHFHGKGCNRLNNVRFFLNLRKIFHVISFDYSGFGDSSKKELTEDGIVADSSVLYKWLVLQVAPNNLYVWGHSLGAALATHTLARLHQENHVPMGLILEAPFTTLREQIEHIPRLSYIFSWLPWFEETFQDGFESNGFYFKTTENILKVDCPIMILHAEDDSIIPYTLGQKLSRIAREKRDPVTQGNVTFHLFPAAFDYNHLGITEAPELKTYISDYIAVCQEFNKKRKTINTRRRRK